MIFNLVSVAHAAVIRKELWEPVGCAKNGVVTIKGLECLLVNILSPLPGMIALVAVGMIIFAGIRIINAGSDTKAYAAGWSTFTYALVGLILLSAVWLALVIVGKYTGTEVTNFGIPQ